MPKPSWHFRPPFFFWAWTGITHSLPTSSPMVNLFLEYQWVDSRLAGKLSCPRRHKHPPRRWWNIVNVHQLARHITVPSHYMHPDSPLHSPLFKKGSRSSKSGNTYAPLSSYSISWLVAQLVLPADIPMTSQDRWRDYMAKICINSHPLTVFVASFTPTNITELWQKLTWKSEMLGRCFEDSLTELPEITAHRLQIYCLARMKGMGVCHSSSQL